MKKMAIFVEGVTEQMFVERLVLAIAGAKNLRIEKRKGWGGKSFERILLLIEPVAPDTGQEYYVLLVDCTGDSRVQSDIRDQYTGLVASGYTEIVGIRDVYPNDRSQIPDIQRMMYYKVKTSPVRPEIILSIMEIETYFVAEYTHFPRIHPDLTLSFIRANAGFDPSADDIELRDHPADDLANIYRLVGSDYCKDRSVVQTTVDILDYARLYAELPDRYPPLKTLNGIIDRFLS